MSFSFKVAPGVRIRASSRGLRTSVGPRAARVHFGAGRTGVSTGVGPVSLYHSVGGSRGRQRGAATRTSVAALERQLKQAARLQQARELAEAFEAIANVHREEFPVATAPGAPEPAPIDQDAIRTRHEQEALRGLGVLKRAARASARQQAAESAVAEIAARITEQDNQRTSLQRQLDGQWQRLLANDPDVVFATLTDAFEDNEAPAAVVSVHAGEASVVLRAPDADAIPERTPELTAAGNLSFKKLTRTTRNSFYTTLVCGHVLVTIREAMAVAPAIEAVRIAVVRWAPSDAYGIRHPECLLAGLFSRRALQGVQWHAASAVQIVNDASAELRIKQGPTGDLRPLDLVHEPALSELLRAVELDEPNEAAGQPAVSATSALAALPSQQAPPPPWRPRPEWGTIGDYTTTMNSSGGVDVKCIFIPDDGSTPIPLSFHDPHMPELGEYARGIMPSHDQLTIKVGASDMWRAEQEVFPKINALDRAKRAQMFAEGNNINEDCGWAWTADYKLVKAAPGLLR
jgi:hypothetical protein